MHAGLTSYQRTHYKRRRLVQAVYCLSRVNGLHVPTACPVRLVRSQEPTDPYQVLTDPEKYLRPMVRRRGQPQPQPPR